MLCGSSIIYLFGCLRVRMFRKRRRMCGHRALLPWIYEETGLPTFLTVWKFGAYIYEETAVPTFFWLAGAHVPYKDGKKLVAWPAQCGLFPKLWYSLGAPHAICSVKSTFPCGGGITTILTVHMVPF